MSRHEGPSPRSARGRPRSDDTSYEYYKTYNDYAHGRRSPSPTKEPTSTADSREAKTARSPSRASHRSRHDDHRRPRTFDNESHSLCDSDDNASGSGEAAPRSTRSTRSTSRGRPSSIRSVKSPRAALHRFSTNIRRSPIPKSPDRACHYTAPNGRPPLPPGWTPQFSTRHSRWFYHNKATGNSQWEAPGFEEKKLRGILLNKADGGGRIRAGGGGGGTDADEGRGRGRGQDGGGDQRRRNSGGRHTAGRHSGGKSSSDNTYAEPHRKHSGLGTAGLLLGVAGGIAAGTLLARALQSNTSRISMTESTVRRKKSCSSFSD